MNPLEGKKILWVEDDGFLYSIILNRIKKEQCFVTNAKNGAEALKFALSDHYDLIILDVLLVDIDGTEILAHLKKNEKTKNIPVIMLSNLDSKDVTERSHKLGAVGFIVKSLTTPDGIINKIKSALAQK